MITVKEAIEAFECLNGKGWEGMEEAIKKCQDEGLVQRPPTAIETVWLFVKCYCDEYDEAMTIGKMNSIIIKAYHELKEKGEAD